MKKIKNLFLILIALAFIAIPMLASAQDEITSTADYANSSSAGASNPMLGRLTKIGALGGYNTTGNVSVSDIVGIAIRMVITLLGLVFIVLIILAGFKWMRAEGNEEEIKKANRTIKESIIGLVITLSAWTIWSFVFEKLILGQ